MKTLSIGESQKYSFDEIKKMALQGGFANIVRGYYMQTGKAFIITASLQNAASGDIIDSFKASGEGEESITTSIDEITRRIKLSFPLTDKQLADDVDVGIGQVPPTRLRRLNITWREESTITRLNMKNRSR